MLEDFRREQVAAHYREARRSFLALRLFDEAADAVDARLYLLGVDYAVTRNVLGRDLFEAEHGAVVFFADGLKLRQRRRLGDHYVVGQQQAEIFVAAEFLCT